VARMAPCACCLVAVVVQMFQSVKKRHSLAAPAWKSRCWKVGRTGLEEPVLERVPALPVLGWRGPFLGREAQAITDLVEHFSGRCFPFRLRNG